MALRPLPQILLSIFALMAICAAMAWGMAYYMQIDFMTAYLATSRWHGYGCRDRGRKQCRYGAHHGNANPTAVQHSVNWASSGPFYINLCAQTTFVGLISVAPSDNSRAPMAVPAISGNAGTSKTGVRKVLSFQ